MLSILSFTFFLCEYIKEIQLSAAIKSIALYPLTSVAVVITAVAFISCAISSESLLAPPICPDKTGITNCPFSSTVITAGSIFLSSIYGAILRTAIPMAPTNICALALLKLILSILFSMHSSKTSFSPLKFLS